MAIYCTVSAGTARTMAGQIRWMTSKSIAGAMDFQKLPDDIAIRTP